MTDGIIVELGGIPIRLLPEGDALRDVILKRFAQFLCPAPASEPFELVMRLAEVEAGLPDDVRVNCENGRWLFERGSFRAEWFPEQGRGWAHCTVATIPVIDSVIRVLYSMLLAARGGMLLHASSAIRGDRAYVFCGVSGAGKSTIVSLAPSDSILLTDEISFIRPVGDGYRAFGTPFAGELGVSGPNVSAPIGGLYLLNKGRENRIEPASSREAGLALFRTILFFARDAALAKALFDTAFRFIERVPVYRLTFVPTAEVWGLIS
jgi:hypothetical protein